MYTHSILDYSGHSTRLLPSGICIYADHVKLIIVKVKYLNEIQTMSSKNLSKIPAIFYLQLYLNLLHHKLTFNYIF